MKTTLCRVVGALLVLLAFLARTSSAQTGAAAPPRPVFAGAGAAPARGQELDLTADVVEAYDDNLLADSGGLSPSLLQMSGFYTMLSPRLEFKSRGERVQIGLSGGTGARYFRQSNQFLVTNHYVGAGFSAQLTRRTGLSFNQGVTYAPSYLYGLFASLAPPSAGDVVPPAPYYAVDAVRSYVYSTTGSFTHNFTTRAAILFNSGYRYTHVVGNDPSYLDLRSYDAGGRFTYSMNRDVKLRLGYTYREAQYSRLLRPTEHDLDIGAEYSRKVSATRKTTFAFNVGPRLAKGTSLGASLEKYGLAADASMNYQMTRNWTAQGGYSRGLSFIDGLQAPVYTDALTTTVVGFLSRRTDLSLTAASASGHLLLTSVSSPFTTYTGDARLRFALGSTLATYVEYLYYYYKFEPGIQLPAGVPSGLTRNGARVGLTLWIPVRRR